MEKCRVGFSKLQELLVCTGRKYQRMLGADGDDVDVSRVARDDGLEGWF